MPNAAIEPTRAFTQQIFERIGTPQDNAVEVADHLVESSLRGMHSHGLIRVPQYLEEARNGAFDPAASPVVNLRHGARVTISGNRAFGQLGGMLAAKEGIRVASEFGCALVTATNLGHTGRIGAYAEAIGRAGKGSIWFASGTGVEGRRVAPFRGRDARLSTNPISYSLPTSTEPVVADFATSAGAEGVVRSLRNRGLQAPPGMLLDDQGRPTNDPNALYSEPAGTIALLGGEVYGHKGFALSLLVEAMSTLVGGLGFDDQMSPHNTIAAIAFEVDDDFRKRFESYISYLRSTGVADPTKPVLLPGDPERSARGSATSVYIDDATWKALQSWSSQLDVAMPPQVGAG